MIYLDNAATAKYRNVDDIIVDTMTTAMRDSWLNPSSLYASNIREKINKCRANVAKFIGASSDEIIFTSGASESNNAAIRGWVDYMRMNTLQPINVITTRIEHKSILGAVQNGTLGARVHYCDVDAFGLVDYRLLKNLLMICENEPTLVSIHMANNEIGTLQDIKGISDLVHKYGGILHTDATQILPYFSIDVEKLGIDMMSASGHKFSPVLKGVGFLYKKKCINIHPFIYGTQENGLRGGTENTFGIIGLSKAIEHCDVSYEKIKEICEKRNYFIELLKSKFDCLLNGSFSRLPNNINVTFPQDITGEALLYMLDLGDVKVGVGSACNSRSIEPSYVLKEIGLTDEESMKTVRFTLSEDITYDDINFVINEIDKCIRIIEK